MAEEIEKDRIKYGLTKKQYDFANEYIRTGDYNAAYKKAYDTKATKENTISSQATKVLKNPKVRRYIDDLLKDAINADTEDINRYDMIMTAQDLMLWWSDVIRSNNRSIKMSDRIKCSELLGKAHGIFTQNVNADLSTDITINITGEDEEQE